MADFFSPTILWFAIALAIFGIEMVINSYFLLAISLGALSGGITSLISPSINNQFIVAGIFTIVTATAVFYLKKKSKTQNTNGLNDDNLDEGQEVLVELVEKDGKAKVFYRGANWQAKGYSEPLDKGLYIIKEIQGSILLLERKK